MSMRPRPVFVLRLRPEPGVDAPRALRGMRILLKIALRRFGLRTIEARQEEPGRP
jgi:hypothetical protein